MRASVFFGPIQISWNLCAVGKLSRAGEKPKAANSPHATPIVPESLAKNGPMDFNLSTCFNSKYSKKTKMPQYLDL